MFAAPSSHKRRRASARGDKSRKKIPGRIVLNTAGIDIKGKARQQSDLEARQRFASVVESHAFNHELTITIPHAQKAERSEEVSSLLERIKKETRRARAAYYVARVPLQVFLNPEFVTLHVKTASLIALSSGHLDTDDIVCLDGQGTLILNLTKNTYQVLGLTGRPSRFALGSSGRTGDRKSGPVERYIVEIPLLDPTFRPGKPGWQRVHDRFEAWSQIRKADQPGCDGRWTIAFAADSRQNIVFPSEVVKESDIDQVRLTCQTKEIQDVWLPNLSDGGGEGDQAPFDGGNIHKMPRGWSTEAGDDRHSLSWAEWTESAAELAEWNHLIGLDAECTRTYFTPPSLPINSYYPPKPHKAGSATVLTVKGFLHPSTISRINTIVTDFLDTSSASLSWVICTASGFTHSPIRWRSHDPGWGLAFGAGRSPADQADKAAGGATVFPASKKKQAQDKDENLSSASESGSDDSEESCPSSDDEMVSLPLDKQTGKKARQKRHRLSKRKGSMRKGEAERSASDGTTSGRGTAGSIGWGCIMFGGSSTDSRASLLWWENVQGDTRS
ncbi:unnamed protein product [Sympodiomycopsis kandeliae]